MAKLTKKHYKVIEPYLPKVRGKVQISHLDFLNALLYVVENDCSWRGLPKKFGKGRTVYMRMRRWKEKGTLQAIFNLLQKKFKLDVDMSVLLQEMTHDKEPSNKTEVRKKTAAKSPSKRVTKKALKST